MTLALTVFLCSEMEELLTLRERVAERDMGELEDVKWKLERLEMGLYDLFDDANSNKPFVPPEPDEDEIVSACL